MYKYTCVYTYAHIYKYTHTNTHIYTSTYALVTLPTETVIFEGSIL